MAEPNRKDTYFEDINPGVRRTDSSQSPAPKIPRGFGVRTDAYDRKVSSLPANPTKAPRVESPTNVRVIYNSPFMSDTKETGRQDMVPANQNRKPGVANTSDDWDTEGNIIADRDDRKGRPALLGESIKDKQNLYRTEKKKPKDEVGEETITVLENPQATARGFETMEEESSESLYTRVAAKTISRMLITFAIGFCTIQIFFFLIFVFGVGTGSLIKSAVNGVAAALAYVPFIGSFLGSGVNWVGTNVAEMFLGVAILGYALNIITGFVFCVGGWLSYQIAGVNSMKGLLWVWFSISLIIYFLPFFNFIPAVIIWAFMVQHAYRP